MIKLDNALITNYKIIHDDLNLGLRLNLGQNLTEYSELITWHNGQISTLGDLQLFAHGSFLSYERSLEIRNENIEIRNIDLKGIPDADKWFRNSLYPLTIDAGGDCLCVDENDGKLYQFVHDDHIAFSGYHSISELIDVHAVAYEKNLVKIDGLSVIFPDGIIRA